MPTILEIDNNYSTLHTDNQEVKTVLWKALRCRALDYWHNPRYKMKLWDGYNDFFKRDTGKFLTGLLLEVRLALKHMGEEYTIQDNRVAFKFAVDEIGESWLNEGPNPIKQLRDYQIDYANQIFKNQRGIISAVPGAGKAQPHTSTVQTITGPKKMGDVKVGDVVLTPSGQANVIGVYPQGKKACFAITFSNKDVVECCGEHLWEVMRKSGGKYKTQVLTTNEIIASGKQYYIKRTQPVTYEQQELRIKPRLMGLLLGDGGIVAGVGFSNADKEVLQSVESNLPDKIKMKYVEKYDWKLVRTCGKKNVLQEDLKSYKVFGHKSYTKFVPDDYKYSSIEDRIELIKGLMDTDGYVDKKGRLEYTSSSFQLAKDFKEVMQSLGAICRMRSKIPSYTYKGQKLKGKRSYTVAISCFDGEEMLGLTRKKNRTHEARKMNWVIKKIEPIGERECSCIMIDDPQHLYLTDNYIPTHNTNVMKAVVKALPPKTPTLILANKTSLVDQNYDEIAGMGIDCVGRLYGKKKEPNYITCATSQSAHLLKPILPKIKVLFVDEIHEMMSKVPKKIYAALKNCPVRIAMSGTPFKFDGKDETQKYEVKGWFGPLFLVKSTEDGKLTTEDLIDQGILSSADCTFYRIGEPKLPYEIYLDAVTKGIAENDYFHNFVVKLVKKLSGRTLIIVDRIEHGDRLKERIKGAEWIKGEDDLDERKRVIERLKTETRDTVAIATSGIFNTGINVFVNSLVNCSGGQADHQIIQRFGRGLRKASDKQHLKYYDFIFEINEYLEKHSWKRVKILEKQGHNITIMEAGVEP